MEGLAGRFRRPRRRVRAGELDERGGAARVRVRARAQPVVVSMSNDDDDLVERPLDDRREIAELDPSHTGHVLAPRVLTDREPVERQLVAEPLRGARRARRARDPTRVVARQLGRQGRRRRSVERRGKRGRGQRPGSYDGDDREQQRKCQEHREVSGESQVDGPLDGAAPGPPLADAEAGGLHAGGYSRAGQAITPVGAPTTDAGTVLDHPPRRRRGRDSVLAHLSARARRLSRRSGARRRRGPPSLRGGERRPRRARHHVAKSRWSRGLPPPAAGEHGADHHAHRPRRRARQGARASSSAPTTTSPSRSRSASSGAVCGRCSAARRPRTTRAVATRWSTAAMS